MASEKPECNQFVRFLNAVLGGIISLILFRAAEKCYNYFRQRSTSRNTAISTTGAATRDTTRALYNSGNTLYQPVCNTPVMSPGQAISDMDRDINKVACQENLPIHGAIRS